MALRPEAFGPLSPEASRAATLLGGPSFSGLNLGRLTGRSFGEPQQAAQSPQEPVGLATGTMAPVEEQQPLLLQGEATGERGDITQLPGFQAAVAPGGAAELPSSAELSPNEQQTATEVRNQLNRLASEGGGSQSAIDAAKGLKAASATLKLTGGLKRLAQSFNSSTPSAPPLPDLGSMVNLQGQWVPDIQAPPGAPMMPTQGDVVPDIVAPPGAEAMPTQAAPGAAGGSSSLGGTIGGASAGLGAIASILGLLGGNDPDMQKAAKALGALSSAGSLAGAGITAGALASSGLMGVASTAPASAAAAGALGAGAGAGLAFAPIAAMTLASALSGLLGGEDPVGEGIGEMMAGTPHYQNFNPALMRNEQQQGTAFNTLKQALPLVQNKEELGRLVNAAKNYVSTTTGIGLDQTDPYTLAAIPGTGPVTHGQQTPTVDWGPEQQMLQQAVNTLKEALPGNPLTQSYEQGGGLTGEPAMRLWTQFLDREKNAPAYLPTDIAPSSYQSGSAVNVLPGATKGFYAPGLLPGMGEAAMTAALQYGQPGYDYAGAGFPEPGQFLGTPSDTWQSLVGQLAGTSPTDTTMSAAAPTDSNALLALQRLVTQSGGQAGSLSPNVGSEFVTALRNPVALQQLLQQPGMLARLYGPTGGQ